MTQTSLRYQAFLRAHQSQSTAKPPNYRFMIWINRQWNTFQAQHPDDAHDQDAFDAWLALQFPPPEFPSPAA